MLSTLLKERARVNKIWRGHGLRDGVPPHEPRFPPPLACKASGPVSPEDGIGRFTRRRRLVGESGKVSGLRNRRQRQRDA